MFGQRVVNGNHRILQRPFARHGAQAQNAGRGFFHAADDPGQQVGALTMERADEIGAIIERDLWTVRERGIQVRIIGSDIFAAHRKRRNAVVHDQRRRDIVLGAERIAGREPDRGAAGLQHAHQIGGFGRDVQAGADAHTGERTRPAETLQQLA